MGNVYEALLQAQLQLDQREAREEPAAVSEMPVSGRQAVMEQEMMQLYLRIETLLPDIPRKILQFTSSRGGEGVSTMVREYAWLGAAQLGLSVLIVDADPGDGGQRQFFRLHTGRAWDQIGREGPAFEEAVCRIGTSSLHVTCCGAGSKSGARSCAPGGIDTFMGWARECFDLVLVDSPPATNVNAAAFTRSVDGVILVVEAEKTRRPVADNAKNIILSNGGSILGIVFNKRRNYIPDSVYALL